MNNQLVAIYVTLAVGSVFCLLPALLAAIFGGGCWMVVTAAASAIALIGVPLNLLSYGGLPGWGLLNPIFGPSGKVVEWNVLLSCLAFGFAFLAIRDQRRRRLSDND